jgi:hypothetical protein
MPSCNVIDLAPVLARPCCQHAQSNPDGACLLTFDTSLAMGNGLSTTAGLTATGPSRSTTTPDFLGELGGEVQYEKR